MAVDIYGWNADAPLVIAHRGASSVAPENTMPAFVQALELGSDAVEMDLKFSRDEALIVHHDQTLDRTTNGSGKVSEAEWVELKKLDAGSYHGQAFAGVRIPLLEEVFDELGDKLLYNLELTEYGRPFTQLVDKVVAMVDRFHLGAHVLYSSFNPVELFRVTRLVGAARVALLVHARTPGLMRLLARALVPHAIFHPQDELVDRTLIRSVHAVGKRINVWTVNSEDRMDQLLGWGSDGIITDLPDRAVTLRERMEARCDGG